MPMESTLATLITALLCTSGRVIGDLSIYAHRYLAIIDLPLDLAWHSCQSLQPKVAWIRKSMSGSSRRPTLAARRTCEWLPATCSLSIKSLSKPYILRGQLLPRSVTSRPEAKLPRYRRCCCRGNSAMDHSGFSGGGTRIAAISR